MHARGFLNYRLKYCWPKVIYSICQPNELNGKLRKKTGGAKEGPSKNLGGHGPPTPSLESPLGSNASFSLRFLYTLYKPGVGKLVQCKSNLQKNKNTSEPQNQFV